MLVEVEHDNPFTILVILVDSNAIFGVGKLMLNPLVENKSSFPDLSGICFTLFVFESDILFDDESIVSVAGISCGLGLTDSAGTTCFLLRETNELDLRSNGLIDNVQSIGS
jgi:hypothetical protein